MKIKTFELTGGALDWAVAIALGWHDVKVTAYDDPDSLDEPFFRPAKIIDGVEVCGQGERWKPSTNPTQGSPLLDKYRICSGVSATTCDPECSFYALRAGLDGGRDSGIFWGPTRLTASMRCIVATELGDEVDVPDELLAA